jgi:hypothetical protein
MSIQPKLRIKHGEPIGNELFFLFPEIQDYEKSYLEADLASGVNSITANGTNFNANDYIVIGQIGSENAEIIKIASATSTTIGTSTNTVFAHNRGELIQFIPYNQIVPERSTDGGVVYAALAALNIKPDSLETYLQRSSDDSTDLYKFRFYNSTTALYSGYSDSTIATGYEDYTVYSICKRALKELNETYSDLITKEFLYDSLNEGRRIVDQYPGMLRWSFRTKFNTVIGQIIPGKYSVSAPTDLRDKNSNKNILSLRIGKNQRLITYITINQHRDKYLDIPNTTLKTNVLAGDATITLTNSGNFDSSGSISIGGAAVGDTIDIATYTSNNETTGVLSGVSGVLAHTAGAEIWQGANFGIPTFYTIYDGVIYFDMPFDEDYDGETIICDYYKELLALTSDSDELDEPFYDMYVSYLKWKIKSLKSQGKLLAKEDPDYLEFENRVKQLISQEMTGQYINFIPT